MNRQSDAENDKALAAPAASTDSFHTTQPFDRTPADSSSGFAPTEAHVGAIPRVFGRYEVRKAIGRGAFGYVYLGFDPVLKRDVAIKTPRRSKAWSASATEKFLKEGQALARLSHENIVAIYDTGMTDEGQPYIVMEYVDGLPLARIAIERSSRQRRINYVSQIAAALHFAHKKGLVHRDLKPGNVLVTAEGIAKVCDFGLAIDEELRVAGEFAGTPSYMSPEQILKKSHLLDGRTDLWSLGIILYEQLTGVRPFKGTTETELFDQILNRPVRPPTQLDESIDKSMERVCLQCLEKDVAQRPAAAHDVLTALQAAEPVGRHGWPLVAAVLLIVIGGLVAWRIFGFGTQPPDGSQVVSSTTRMNLKPIAWPTTSAGDFYELSDETGRITIKSSAYLCCFETHQTVTDQYRFGISADYQFDSGVAGIVLGIHQTNTSPDQQRCWLMCVRENSPQEGMWLTVEECELGMNEIRHLDIRSRRTVDRIKLGDRTQRSFALEVEVDRQHIANVKYDDRPIPGLNAAVAELKIPPKTGCGIVAMSHVVFHSVNLKEQ